jgi:hypothetical protein
MLMLPLLLPPFVCMQLSLVRVDCSSNYASEWGACLLGQHVGGTTITNSSFLGNLVSWLCASLLLAVVVRVELWMECVVVPGVHGSPCLLGQHVGSVTITDSSFVGNLVSWSLNLSTC